MAIVDRGNGVYLIRVYLGRDRVTKKRRQVNVTVHGSLEEAEKHEQLLKGKVKKGELSEHARMTLDRLFNLFMDYSRHYHSEPTQYKYQVEWMRYICPRFGATKITEIRTSDIQQLLNFMLDPKKELVTARDSKNQKVGLGLSINTVRQVRGTLSVVFNFALAEKLIMENPVSRTLVPKKPRPDVNPMTVDEAWAFTSVRKLFWYGDAHWFALQTGLRPEELMALIWDDINFDCGLLHVRRACKWIGGIFKGFGPVKSQRSERTIRLADEHVEFLGERLKWQNEYIRERAGHGQTYGEPSMAEWLLRERPKRQHTFSNTNLIFHSRRGDVPCIRIPRANFKAMLRRAGFPESRLKIRWYDLRHTHATFLLTMGMPAHEVAERMGHSVEELNRTYSHVLPERQRVASDLFVKLIPLNVSSPFTLSDIQRHLQYLISSTNIELEKSLLGMTRETRT